VKEGKEKGREEERSARESFSFVSSRQEQIFELTES